MTAPQNRLYSFGAGISGGLLSLFAPSAHAEGAKVSFCGDKPVEEVFRESLGFGSIPLSGKYVFLLSKDADTDTLVTEAGPRLTSRDNKQNTPDLTLQAPLWCATDPDLPCQNLSK